MSVGAQTNEHKILSLTELEQNRTFLYLNGVDTRNPTRSFKKYAVVSSLRRLLFIAARTWFCRVIFGCVGLINPINIVNLSATVAVDKGSWVDWIEFVLWCDGCYGE